MYGWPTTIKSVSVRAPHHIVESLTPADIPLSLSVSVDLTEKINTCLKSTSMPPLPIWLEQKYIWLATVTLTNSIN